MSRKITDSVSWVGKVDWELRKFHGEEYSTFKGSSYNSYLVRGEKNVLIDTVYAPHAKEFVRNLQAEIDLADIDYVVMHHAEVDHSGAFPELMRHIPDVPVYCSANCLNSLRGLYHRDWNFRKVRTGDSLDLGGRKLVFVTAPMLHWPDSMFSYLTGDNVFFSNDAFGHHLASHFLFNDQVDQAELYHECLKYYANILTPFSALVTKKINEILAMNLPVDYICPSHGVVWRKDPLQIVNRYLTWAGDYQENRACIMYDTMWEATRSMAEAVAEGLRLAAPDMDVTLANVGKRDKNEVVAEIFRSRLVVAGCPTINRGILSGMAAILEMIKGLGFKGKKGAAFGSYGWSGESPALVAKGLEEAGFGMLGEPLKMQWKPDAAGLSRCVEFGREIVAALG